MHRATSVRTVEGPGGERPVLDPVQAGFHARRTGCSAGSARRGMLLTARACSTATRIRRGRRSARRSRGRSAAAPGTRRSSARFAGAAEHSSRGGGRMVTQSNGARRRRTLRARTTIKSRAGSAGCSARRIPASSGAGAYVDDVSLPGMLHGAILRSPVADARIVSIDTWRPLQHIRRCKRSSRARIWRAGTCVDADAVNDVAGRACDRQGAFSGAGGRVRVAEGRIGPRWFELIDVEYDPLHRVVDVTHGASTHRRPGDPDDQEGKTDNHIFDWESGDAPPPRRYSRSPRWWSRRRCVYPRTSGTNGDLRRGGGS